MDSSPVSLNSILATPTPAPEWAPAVPLADLLGAILARGLGRFSTLHDLQKELGDFLAQKGLSLAPEVRRQVTRGLALLALASVGSPLQAILDGDGFLKKGAKGPETGLVQDLLREEGFSIDDVGGKYRGCFGPQTLRALLGSEKLPESVPAETLPAAPAPADPPEGGLNIDAAGLELIAGFEQFEPRIYPDPTRHPTIGYGHLLRPGEEARFAGGITREEGQELLRSDAAMAAQAVNELVTVELNQNQFNALVSFTFNVGRGGLAGSTLLRELNRGNYQAVAGQLNRWVYSDGVFLRGLERRRVEEGNLFNTPP